MLAAIRALGITTSAAGNNTCEKNAKGFVNMKMTAVIMAGGRGERFWPRSRNSFPKQFLSLTGDGETMIQKTVSRLGSLVAPEDVFIVTNESYAALVK